MAFENKTFSSEDTLHADDMNNIMEGIVEAKTAAAGGVKATVNEDTGTSTNTLTIVVKDTNGNELATTTVTLPSGGGGSGDMSNYVQKTDYAKGPGNSGNDANFLAGIVSIVKYGNGGVSVSTNGNGQLLIYKATHDVIDSRVANNNLDGATSGANNCRPITPAVLDYAVMKALADCKITWTEEQKAAARTLLGIE